MFPTVIDFFDLRFRILRTELATREIYRVLIFKLIDGFFNIFCQQTEFAILEKNGIIFVMNDLNYPVNDVLHIHSESKVRYRKNFEYFSMR